MKVLETTLVLFLSLLSFFCNSQESPITKESFENINLAYPGLEKVNIFFNAAQYDEAAAALLNYYRNIAKAPEYSNSETPADINVPISNITKEMADNALLHQFKPHKGYGFFDYGKDINWQYWPVKDNEVRWQLHRVKWWQSLALVYYNTKDERYAKEWMFEFLDWVKKNPLGLSADNDRFAWRPLEISDRIQNLVPTFNIFLKSPNMTPLFLMTFLNSYHQQTNHLNSNFAKEGNHRLFEAQRTLYAGASFPEFKNSPNWRKNGIDILNSEIKKQVNADGLQFELSPIYHVASIDIFLKAYSAAMAVHMENEFPESYKKTVENMIMANINITFPDYNAPMFGDSWIINKKNRIEQYQSWLKVFPQNSNIEYFATEGKKGTLPPYLSKELSFSGFYAFRNGWTSPSTIMILKASIPGGDFHSQSDNGTFELWVNGRNFTPDSGVFVYSGDAEVIKMRNWYRQTKIHQTLTLNNENMLITKATLSKWETGKNLDVLTYTNPSYTDLYHQRSVLFIDHNYFLIIDKAIGKATGNLGVHFQLKEDCKAVFDKKNNSVHTNYADENNLLIQSLNIDKVSLNEEEGKVSYEYRKEFARPAFVFEKAKKDDKTQQFITVVYPYNGNKVPKISITANKDNDFEKGNIDLSISINGNKSELKTNL